MSVCLSQVGYVSPDLFTHSVSYFAEAPLSHHSAARVQLFVYSCVGKPDVKTARLQSKVRGWVPGAARLACARTNRAQLGLPGVKGACVGKLWGAWLAVGVRCHACVLSTMRWCVCIQLGCRHSTEPKGFS